MVVSPLEAAANPRPSEENYDGGGRILPEAADDFSV
jgi:hypothetical protein